MSLDQNKPFCGMHWYTGIRGAAPGSEPAPFEWAGGLPVLTRVSRPLYESTCPPTRRCPVRMGT